MSQSLSIFGLVVTIYPESQGLEDDDDDDDDDNGEEFRSSSHSEHPSPLCKSNDSSDDNQTEDLGKPTPFSLTPRHSYMVKDEQVGLAKHAVELEGEGQEFQEPFYQEMIMSDSLAGDEDPSPTYHRSGHQRLPALQTASRAPSGPSQHSPGQEVGTEAAATQAHARDSHVGHPGSTTGAEPHTLHEEAGEHRESPSLQPTYDMLRKENSMLVLQNKMVRNENCMLMSENFEIKQTLKELKKDRDVLMEQNARLSADYNMLRKQYDRLSHKNGVLRKDNALLRRMFNTFQDNLKRQACLLSSLKNQLKTSQAEREREAQELQSLVQQTEGNLQLMTQRAVDAEINVERLKQKIFILQGQLERSKLGNENLRADWPGSSEARLRLHHARPPQAHNGHKWLPQAAPASGMKVLPTVSEVLESTRKILKF